MATVRTVRRRHPSAPSATSAGEERLVLQLRAFRLPAPVREHRFDTTRRWRFDFAWPDLRLAVEVEGGAFSGGRHTRGTGFEGDCEKYNSAAEQGWRVLRFTTGMVDRGEAIGTLQRILKGIDQSASNW